jgi:signal transduction histidine kinase
MITYGIRYKEYLDLKLRESTRDVESRAAIERATAAEKIQAERDILQSTEESLNFIAHELRTPLTALQGHVQLLQRHSNNPNPERLSTSLAGMNHAVLSMRRLIDNLLSTSRSEAGADDHADTEVVNLRELADAVALELRAVAEEQGVTLEVCGSGQPAAVRGNRTVLESIIANLIANAIKYSPNGGTIRIAATVVEGQVQCSVTDQGIGISDSDISRIFDKYFRGTNTKSVQGVGLGLTVAQAAARRYGGWITVESKVGEGSTFCLILPAAGKDAS